LVLFAALALSTPALAGTTRLVTSEEADLLQGALKDLGGVVVREQSFRVDLPLPDARFVIAWRHTQTYDEPPFEYLLVSGGGAVLQRLAPAAYWDHFEGVAAVAFSDMNGDGHGDLTFILTWMTGIGAGGTREFPAASLYTFDTTTQRYLAASELLASAPFEATTSISSIREYLKANANKSICDGEWEDYPCRPFPECCEW